MDGTADQPPGGGFTAADVSDPSDVDRLFDDVMAGLGGLDVLCANVGIAGPTGPVEELEASDWDRTMAVNVRSAFLCCRRAVPLLREAGGGSILLTASTAGITGYPMRSPYAASKYAVVGLGQTLAMEVGELGIRVNVICPGSVDGERMDTVSDWRSIQARAERLIRLDDPVFDNDAAGDHILNRHLPDVVPPGKALRDAALLFGIVNAAGWVLLRRWHASKA